MAVVGKDDYIWFLSAQGQHPPHLQRVQGQKSVQWDRSFPGVPDTAALLVEGNTAFCAHYHNASTGATVRALDLATGADRWFTQVQGLGPISHKKYRNHVVLTMIRGALVVFGDEGSGRYIEVFDPQTGKMLSTRTLPRT